MRNRAVQLWDWCWANPDKTFGWVFGSTILTTAFLWLKPRLRLIYTQTPKETLAVLLLFLFFLLVLASIDRRRAGLRQWKLEKRLSFLSGRVRMQAKEIELLKNPPKPEKAPTSKILEHFKKFKSDGFLWDAVIIGAALSPPIIKESRVLGQFCPMCKISPVDLQQGMGYHSSLQWVCGKCKRAFPHDKRKDDMENSTRSLAIAMFLEKNTDAILDLDS